MHCTKPYYYDIEIWHYIYGSLRDTFDVTHLTLLDTRISSVTGNNGYLIKFSRVDRTRTLQGKERPTFKAFHLWLNEGIKWKVNLLFCRTSMYIHQQLCRLVQTRLCQLTSQHVHTPWPAQPIGAELMLSVKVSLLYSYHKIMFFKTFRKNCP